MSLVCWVFSKPDFLYFVVVIGYTQLILHSVLLVLQH